MTSPISDRKITIDGTEFCWCSRHKDHKPCVDFGRSTKSNTGYQYICKECSARATSTVRYDDHYENPKDLKLAHELIELLGYNTKSEIPIHKQLEQKHNITNDTI